MIVSMNPNREGKSKQLLFTVPTRLGTVVREMSAVTRHNETGNETTFSMPATLLSYYQLKQDWPDAEYTGEVKTHRKWVLSQRKQRVSIKRGRDIQTSDKRMRDKDQTIGLNLLMEGSCLLADEMGYGKTVQACAALDHMQTMDSQVLVLAPKSALYVWHEHVLEYTNYTPFIVHGTKQASELAAYEEHEGPKVLIATHAGATKYSKISNV